MTLKNLAPELADTMALEAARPDPGEGTTGGTARDSDRSSFTSEKLAGRYELVALLGSGGMGTVYQARDVTLDEMVALKVLREELADDPTMLHRFRREVKLARKVTHPNVARTFDIGEHGPRTFLTMELILGKPLSTVATPGVPMPMARIVEIANAMCAGLGAAHAAGVVHRDLKPENILLANDGRILITDFGIAQVASSSAVAKTQGIAVGTPAYMAPEQVEGAPDLDGRADIYALGTILFELWTGSRAWEGDSVYVVASKRLFEPPPDPRQRRHDVPEQAVRIIMRCMATARADRFQNVAEVASALARLSLVASIPPGPPERITLNAPLKTVAVLPFRNRGTPGDEYVAEGLTEDLIDLLSVTEGLRVCARGIVAARAPSGDNVQAIGASLGVHVVVDGSVRRSEQRLRVTARVVSVGDGFQLWAKRLDYAESDFFELSDAMAREVASALTCTVVGAPREAPNDPLALDLYLRARHEYHKYWGDNLLSAIDLYRQALSRAPNDPMILAGYAMAVARNLGFNEGDDALADTAREAAERAVAIAPHLPAAKVARAYQRILYNEGVLAGRDLREVLLTTPDSVDALDLSGHVLAEAGAFAEGLARLRRTMALEPGMLALRFDVARLLALGGDGAASEELFGDPPEQPGLSNVYWVNRARVAFWQRDVTRAKVWFADLVERDHIFPAVLAMLQVIISGETPPVVMQGVQRQAASTTPLLRRRAFYSMIVAEFTPDESVALDAIEGVDAAQGFDVTWFDQCPSLDRFRLSPRFLSARARVAERAAEVRRGLAL